MTLNREQAASRGSEAKEDSKEKNPIRAKLLEEIAAVQIQTYRNNLALGRTAGYEEERDAGYQRQSANPGNILRRGVNQRSSYIFLKFHDE